MDFGCDDARDAYRAPRTSALARAAVEIIRTEGFIENPFVGECRWNFHLMARRAMPDSVACARSHVVQSHIATEPWSWPCSPRLAARSLADARIVSASLESVIACNVAMIVKDPDDFQGAQPGDRPTRRW